MRWPSDNHLRRINWILYAVIIGCGVYLMLTPFWPKVALRVSDVFNKPKQSIAISAIDRSKEQLYIPSIKLTQPIFESNNPQTVNKGVWRLPHGSTPNRESNTVLVGHRFSYKNPSVFYHLDRVSQGDTIYVSWKKKIYVYKVDKIRTVTPDTISVEDPTDKAQLTIYTCTPLWSTSHRLVVESKLEKIL